MTKQEAFLQKNHPVMWLAAKHHRTHKNNMLDFKNRPFLKYIYLSNGPKDIMKSTQCGITEWLTVLTIELMRRGLSIFYVLPTLDLVGRFVRNRFDRSIEFSKLYSQLVGSTESKSASVSLKHIGAGSVAFVGSNTPKVFTEYPADVMINDEKDQCNQANLAMGVERLSESELRWEFRVSNPTVMGYGIHEDFLAGNQMSWMVQCDCGNWVDFDFFKHVVRKIDESQYVLLDEDFEWDMGRDINVVCDKCGKPIDRRKDGQWVPKYPDRGRDSLHISKLFTTNVTIREMVDRFNAGLTKPDIMQRFYNGDLGLPYTAKGSKIDKDDLDKCVEDFNMDKPTGPCVIGIDVGARIHVRINQVMEDGLVRAVYIGSVSQEKEIDWLFEKFPIRAGVIDANPERRMAERLAMRHPGLFQCFYGQVKRDSIDLQQKIITVRRTSALDNVMDAILRKRIQLPKDAEHIPEYYDHMMASTRIFDPNASDGSGDYKWVESGADHFFHAEGYALIARNMLLSMAGQ